MTTADNTPIARCDYWAWNTFAEADAAFAPSDTFANVKDTCDNPYERCGTCETCTMARRGRLVDAANEPGGRPLPILRTDSTREELQDWLQACDPNGCHTDLLYSEEQDVSLPCAECDGTGTSPDFDRVRDCKECAGTGLVLEMQRAYEDLAEAWDAVAEMLEGC